MAISAPTQLFINGEWRDAEHGRTFPVHDPATGVELAQVADASPGNGLAALTAAVDAQEDWASTTPLERSELLRRAFEAVMDQREELAALMTAEMGKPLAEARGEVTYGAEYLRWFAAEALQVGGRHGRNPEGTGDIIVTRRPVGPCYLVTPWNFPLAMATRKIAPAIAAGCTAVVKPASLTPLTTLAFVELLARAGLPAGVVNVVPTSSSGALTEPILADRRLRKLSFTGSTEVGRTLLRQAADGVLRTSMELGGNAPFLVFDDADLDVAVAGAMLAKFRNGGQACTAANRFLVHERVAEEFTARLVARIGELRLGAGSGDGVTLGPLIDVGAVQRISEAVDDAVARGARLVHRGQVPDDLPREGHFLAPAVLTEVPVDAPLWREEIFGPVVALRTFADEDEAVTLANDTDRGLVSYAFTRDLARGHRLLERLDSGMVGLSSGIVSNAAAPFGGIKTSGLGREGGELGIEEYQSVRYAFLPRS
ncbi:NAD-dependent succinate-semialdehyde dehydrogenase [Salana multivorans]